MSTMIDPRYPIGKFSPLARITDADRDAAIETISQLPERLRSAIDGWNDDHLDTPYREGGWTVRQVVHHVADSHSTALFRLKKALSEDWPTVPGYPEATFAELVDAAGPIHWSLPILDGVHARWTAVLRALNTAQWKRGYVHEERGRTAIDEMTVHYAWHAKHHLAHVTELAKAQGWHA